MKKEISVALIGALVILQIYSSVKINSLENKLENIHNNINSAERYLGNQISSSYQDIQQKIEEKESLIHHSFATIGTFDDKTLTVPITFTVQPKSVTETMRVSLDFEGEIIPLEKSGIGYYGIRDFELSDNVFPTIVLEDQGIRMIEAHQGLRVAYLREEVFPYLSGHFSGESSYNHGTNDYREKGEVRVKYRLVQENNPFTEINYVVKVDDTIIEETPLKLESEVDERIRFNIDEQYTLKSGQTLTTNLMARDALGFIHEYVVDYFVAGSNAQREYYFAQEKIMAPDGTIVYEYEESEYK